MKISTSLNNKWVENKGEMKIESKILLVPKGILWKYMRVLFYWLQ